VYGLPQAGILAHKLLVKRLAPHGYAPTNHTPGLWTHKTRPILLSLVVDDFGVKYVGKEHADNLIATLKLLPSRHGRLIHARLRRPCPHQIPAPRPYQTSPCAGTMDVPELWRQGSMGRTRHVRTHD
jgi:hypothetical protein